VQPRLTAITLLIVPSPQPPAATPRGFSEVQSRGLAGEIEQRAIAADKNKRASDAEIRKRIIAESIESYPRNCACPYQSASNGSRCGRRSAYDRGGGYAPLCYPRDVSDEMVTEYRARMDE
jgi:hypothetical protein